MKNKARLPFVCMLVCYLAYTSVYVARINLSIASAELISTGHMTASQIGTLGTVFSVIYALGRLYNSTLADRTSPFILICGGLLTGGLANVFSGLLPVYPVMAVLWGLNAYGQSMLWGSILRAFSVVYDAPTAKRRSAVVATTLAVGNLLGILLNTWLISRLNVRFAYFVPGGINLILVPVVWYGIGSVRLSSTQKSSGFLSAFRLFGNRDVRAMLIPAMCHGILKDNISAWMAVFFVTFFGIDLEKSSWFILLIPTIGLVGRLIYNSVYRLCKSNEHVVSLLCFCVALPSACVLIFSGIPPLLAAVCLAVIYAAISMVCTSLLAIFPMRFAKDNLTASVSGIMDFTTYTGAGIFSMIYGILIDAFGNTGFTLMFASWGLFSLLSIGIIGIYLKRHHEA